MGESERIDIKKEDFYADKEGQLSFLDPQVENYFPTASDYGKIPNRFIERYSSISYLANLGLMAAIQNVSLRDSKNYAGTREGEFYKSVVQKGGANFAEGLVSCIPISSFLKTYGLSRGGHNYNALQELYNGHLMANQWNIIYEDKDIISCTAVVTATLYSKETGNLYIKFNSDLQDVLLNLSKEYATLSLPVMGKLKEDYTVSMYQLFKKRYDYEVSRNKRYYGRSSEEVTINFENLDEFYFLTGMYPVDMMSQDPSMLQVIDCLKTGQYSAAAAVIKESNILQRSDIDQAKASAVKDFRRFKARFLDKAFKRINGFEMIQGLDSSGKKNEEALQRYYELCKLVYPTDIHFRYETIRGGQGGRVRGIKVMVSKADWTDNNVIEARKNEKNSEGIEDYSLEQIQVIVEIKQLIEENLSVKDMIAIASEAGWDMQKIQNAYAVAKEQTAPIGNIVGYMINAIRKGYVPSSESLPEQEVEEYPMNRIRIKLGYDKILSSRPDISKTAEVFFDIIYDTLNSEAPKIRAGSSLLPAETVREKIMDLAPEDIISAIDEFIKNDASPTPSYIIGGLYMARMKAILAEEKPDNGYSKPAGKNSFNDFPQRNYTTKDYEELERRKLKEGTK